MIRVSKEKYLYLQGGGDIMRSDVYQDYFQWLCEMVHIDQEDRSYWILAKDLHQHPFYSLIPHDENRASDGLELREDYLHMINYPKYVSIDGECTVFEMLVALARRMDFETSDPYDKDDYHDRTAYWFWEMMDNLGLIVFSDDCYVEYDGMANVERIIDRFLERRYSRSGDGGLFPLYRGRGDQRNVEIWYQMSAYLMEKEAV